MIIMINVADFGTCMSLTCWRLLFKFLAKKVFCPGAHCQVTRACQQLMFIESYLLKYGTRAREIWFNPSNIGKYSCIACIAGVPMKGEIEGAAGSSLRQTATQAVMIDVPVLKKVGTRHARNNDAFQMHAPSRFTDVSLFVFYFPRKRMTRFCWQVTHALYQLIHM